MHQLAPFPFTHIRHLVYLALLVVRNPLPNLFSGFKVPRPHFGAILPEPLPISIHLAVNDHPLALYAAAFVILDVFVLHGLMVPFYQCHSRLFPLRPNLLECDCQAERICREVDLVPQEPGHHTVCRDPQK